MLARPSGPGYALGTFDRDWVDQIAGSRNALQKSGSGHRIEPCPGRDEKPGYPGISGNLELLEARELSPLKTGNLQLLATENRKLQAMSPHVMHLLPSPFGNAGQSLGRVP
jgi:hypothetical protein